MKDFFFRKTELYAENFFFFPTIYRQNSIRSRFFTPIFKVLWAVFYPQMRAAKWLPRGEDFPRRAGPRP